MSAETADPDTCAAVLKGVHPEWVQLFKDRGLMPCIQEALDGIKDLSPEEVSPPPPLIFEAFRYFAPGETRVVIIGQDPYPTGAMGLCFSILSGTPLKQSLVTIMKNLTNHKLAAKPVLGAPTAGDLRPWAVQGVLLLNAALTTRIGQRRSHYRLWDGFVRGVIRAVSTGGTDGRLPPTPTVFMLWGRDAQQFAGSIPNPLVHWVYYWSHPSPLANNRLGVSDRFENAPHFVDANAVLPTRGEKPVCWDPAAPSCVFTDGACTGNGAPAAAAGFGVVFSGGPLSGTRIAGRVAPRAYRLVPGRPAPPGGVSYLLEPDPDSPETPPTNNRGEYLGMCWALLALLRAGVQGEVEVVSDSRLVIQTLNEWLPARREKGTEKELANYDLVVIADTLYRELIERLYRASGKQLLLTHVRSHQPPPPNDAPMRDRLLWKGNDVADKVATTAVTTAPSDFTVKVTRSSREGSYIVTNAAWTE